MRDDVAKAVEVAAGEIGKVVQAVAAAGNPGGKGPGRLDAGEGVPHGLPPSVPRGQNVQGGVRTVGVHWLAGSFPQSSLADVQGLLEHQLGEPGRTLQEGFNGYTDSIAWECGALVGFDQDAKRCERVHKGRAFVSLSGSVVDKLAPEELLDLMAGLAHLGFRATRVDVFWDDYDRTITPERLSQIADAGDFKGFRTWGVKRESIKQKPGTKLTRDEVFFGVRGKKGTGKYVRVYDKFLESDGVQNCIRWELETSGEVAEEVFRRLVDSRDLSEFGSRCGEYIGGALDFRIGCGLEQPCRCDRYAWWEAIVSRLGSVHVCRAVVKATLRAAQAYMSRAFARILAMLRMGYRQLDEDAFGFEEWLDAVANRGLARLAKHDLAKVAAFVEEVRCASTTS